MFGQLCGLIFEHWIRVVFLNRVYSYSINGTKQIGFIPDIVSILGKYGLLGVLTAYQTDGVFPSRLVWNKRVSKKIQEREEYLWHSPHPGSGSDRTIASERQNTALATLYIGGSVTCSQKKTQGA